MMLDIVLIEDSGTDAELVQRAITRAGVSCVIRRAMDRDTCIAALRLARPDLVICDHQLPQFEGREALRLVQSLNDPPPFILVTGSLDEETAVEYMRMGAADYILKDRLIRLGSAVKTALERDRDRRAKALADAARRDSEERLSLVVRATNDAVWDLDVIRGTLEVNEGFHSLIGYGEAHVPLTLDAWHARVHDEDRRRVRSGFLSVLESRASYWTDEYRLRLANGSFGIVLDRAYVMREESGRAIRVIGALMDVSERQRLQEQLQQSQKMEAIGRLAGGIAHDFNNVLTGILISTDLLLNGDQSPNATAEELQHIRSAAERAADLTRQLLAFSRKQVIALRRIDINEVVRDFSVMIQRLIGENVELRLDLTEKLGSVRADPGQLEQILLNLAVNARDAMPGGGELTLVTANVDLDEAFSRGQMNLAPGPYVLIAVGDTGVGMDAEIRDRIFEPFFTTKEPGKGTGLGLATVYGIVRQHGGDIRVFSEPACGTTFKIYLPRVDGPPELQVKPVGDTSKLDGTETILLVEDEDRVRELTRRILVRHGYSVLPAGDAAEALVLAGHGKGRIDLLITDVVLPGASGPELAEELVARGYAGPVLFLSGYSEDAVMSNGHLQPHALFLGKPFTPASLALKVREALAHRVGVATGST